MRAFDTHSGSKANENYRPEIDGMRALAVSAVVIYHMNWTWLPGGYLGVDIFFVISGYLIGRILLRELARGKFSFLRFYERRVRRLLPALLGVIAVCIPLAWLSMDAVQLEDFGESVVMHGLLASNFFFWTNSGYFSPSAETMPLLHTWSLAVEEQFYIVFPILIFCLWKAAKSWALGVILLLFSASLALAIAGSIWWDTANFFLLPGRGWELLAGVGLAHVETKHGSARLDIRRALVALFGLILIVVSVLGFRSHTPHPSLLTVPTVLGTALLIRYGRSPGMFQVLSTRPLVGLGLISYSLYLWHFPILVFARLFNLGELPQNFALWYLPLVVGVASASWWLLETPIRRAESISGTRLFCVSAVIWSIPMVLGATAMLANGFPLRIGYPPELEASFSREDSGGTCIDNPGAHIKSKDWFCEIGPISQGPIAFIVTGDSHAWSILPAFREVAAKLGVRAIAVTDSGCPPFLGMEPIRGDQGETNCRVLNERVASFSKDEQPAVVFMVARWTYYTVYGQFWRDHRTGDQGATTPERVELMRRNLEYTLDEYNKIGVRIVVLGQVPMQRYDAQEIYKKVYLSDAGDPDQIYRLSVSREEHAKLQRDTSSIFDSNERLTFIDPTSIICDEHRCPVGTKLVSSYADDDHLSGLGSLKLVPILATQLGEF